MKGDPEVRDIRALKYDPINNFFFYKIHFDNDYKELPNYQSCTKKVDIAKKRSIEVLKVFETSIEGTQNL